MLLEVNCRAQPGILHMWSSLWVHREHIWGDSCVVWSLWYLWTPSRRQHSEPMTGQYLRAALSLQPDTAKCQAPEYSRKWLGRKTPGISEEESQSFPYNSERPLHQDFKDKNGSKLLKLHEQMFPIIVQWCLVMLALFCFLLPKEGLRLRSAKELV
jgi:hypothetical protein